MLQFTVYLTQRLEALLLYGFFLSNACHNLQIIQFGLQSLFLQVRVGTCGHLLNKGVHSTRCTMRCAPIQLFEPMWWGLVLRDEYHPTWSANHACTA